MQRRGETQRVELAVQGGQHARVGVADVDDEDAGDAVEIALAVDVPVPDALGPCHHQGRGQEALHLAEIEHDMPQHVRRRIARQVFVVGRGVVVHHRGRGLFL